MQVPQSRINTGFSLPQLFFETDALHQFSEFFYITAELMYGLHKYESENLYNILS